MPIILWLRKAEYTLIFFIRETVTLNTFRVFLSLSNKGLPFSDLILLSYRLVNKFMQ
jgi:hypothetical protein